MNDRRARTVEVRTLELPAEPSSVRAARRLVRDVLVATDSTDWLDAAELAVSELVTNAVLHGHSTAWVTVSVDERRLRVEVRDASPRVPSLRHYDDEATTGRGMALVEAVTDAHGVQELGAVGKVVWFELGEVAGPQEDDDAGSGWTVPSEPAPADGEAVVLTALPPLLWLAACEHEDALLREVALTGTVAETERAGADLARARLRDAVGRAVARWTGPGSGSPSPDDVPPGLDVELTVSREDEGAFTSLRAVLEAAELTAARHELLVPASLPEIADMRAWACEEVLGQLAGRPGRSWSGLDAAVRADPTSPGPLDESLQALRAGDGSVVAADETNRILSVTPSLAEALGWTEAELVGRRVVVLVPDRYRQAHVAGFIRHLSTGATTVTNVQLELPLLHRAGHEVPCHFLLETRRTGRGRALYLAWITPVDS